MISSIYLFFQYYLTLLNFLHYNLILLTSAVNHHILNKKQANTEAHQLSINKIKLLNKVPCDIYIKRNKK